jgi:hypothetical protein
MYRYRDDLFRKENRPGPRGTVVYIGLHHTIVFSAFKTAALRMKHGKGRADSHAVF